MKGRIWKDGKFWRAEIRALNVLVKGTDREEALKLLTDELDEISDEMEYDLIVDDDGNLALEPESTQEAIALLVKRNILKS